MTSSKWIKTSKLVKFHSHTRVRNDDRTPRKRHRVEPYDLDRLRGSDCKNTL